MSAHALLNLLNELAKSVLDVLRMLDSIYHMTFKLLRNRIFGVKYPDFVFYATL